MKKVLILTVIAILALGVMALATVTAKATSEDITLTPSITINVDQWTQAEYTAADPAPVIANFSSSSQQLVVGNLFIGSNAAVDLQITTTGTWPTGLTVNDIKWGNTSVMSAAANVSVGGYSGTTNAVELDVTVENTLAAGATSGLGLTITITHTVGPF